MAPDFDPWPWRWQKGPHTTGRSYSTQDEFYSNTRSGIGLSEALHKGFCTVEAQKSEEE